MLEWLKAHVFIAAWLSPVIALVGMILKKRPDGAALNWDRVVVRVALLSVLAVAVTPGVEAGVRSSAMGIFAFGFSALLFSRS
jgi:hypothetical protein